MIMELIFIMIIVLLFFPIINAGPYGYGDSMNLNYKTIDGKIYYRYGESTTFTTSLRPKDANVSLWKADVLTSYSFEVMGDIINATTLCET